jgi:hypothetical protein
VLAGRTRDLGRIGLQARLPAIQRLANGGERGQQSLVAAALDQPAVEVVIGDRQRARILARPAIAIAGHAQLGEPHRIEGRRDAQRQRLEDARDRIQLARLTLVEPHQPTAPTTSPHALAHRQRRPHGAGRYARFMRVL